MQATLADSPSRSACWAALNERDKMEQYMTEARMLAAQCFCDEDTSGIEMDARLAEAVARKFAPILADAARYRWLRDIKRVSEGVAEGGIYIGIESREIWALCEEAADAAIDAALTAAPSAPRAGDTAQDSGQG